MAKAKKRAAPSKQTVCAWEDDPAGNTPVVVPAPDPAAKPLAFGFPSPTPAAARYEQGTAKFRYWAAVEALRRGADFWSPFVAGGRWQIGAKLPVKLDRGVDFNAYYDRKALNFFHGTTKSGTVYSGESPDIVCHEMGHAVLDSVKPGLWDAATQEVAAFHESFGDMSAILSALQSRTLRIAVLEETSGVLYRNSRLSRLAEQLGAAIRAVDPDAVEPDCLRNAVNSFVYHDPMSLPHSGPATQLSSEPHSFSRVFTGAFLQALGSVLVAAADKPDAPTQEELLAASRDAGAILMEGIQTAPIVANFYSHVATAVVAAANKRNAACGQAFSAAFVHRGILSLRSAAATHISQLVDTGARGTSPSRDATAPLTRVALDAARFGLGNSALFVYAASHARRVSVFASARGGGELTPPSADAAAAAFVEDLLRRGRVDLGAGAGAGRGKRHGFAEPTPAARLKSHRLVEHSGGLSLERILFDCGHRHGWLNLVQR